MIAPPGRKGDYTLNEDLADKAIAWIKAEKSLAPDRPFFVYYAPGASHAPLQAPKAWIDKFKGQFDMGWDRYREIVFERQKKLGVVPQNAKLTPRPAQIPAWDSLTPGQKKVAARLMEVFAGFTAQSDHELGRVIDAIADTGQLDNTLIFYIAGDNGASMEGGLNGTANCHAAGSTACRETTADMLAMTGRARRPHHHAALSGGLGVGGQYAVSMGQAHRLASWRHARPPGRLLARRTSRTPAASAISSKT